ncbi:MAG: hypothetical protein KBT35_02555 [Firmicutes bacterium]|nr:hypothetical protein [Candidatus Colivicinus equi]
MNKLLKKLFDFQKFEENQELKNIIAVSEQYDVEFLSDEQLSYVYGGKSEEEVKSSMTNKIDDKK